MWNFKRVRIPSVVLWFIGVMVAPRIVYPLVSVRIRDKPQHRREAQLVEQYTHNVKEVGSIPIMPTKMDSSSMVEQLPDTQKGYGSNPYYPTKGGACTKVARLLCKQTEVSSILTFSTNYILQLQKKY